MTRLEEAAARVRVARTMAVARQDDESAAELVAALEAFRKLTGAPASPVDPKNFGNPDFKEPS